MSEIDFEFARRDDCLDRMVPSDLRRIVSERDHLRGQARYLVRCLEEEHSKVEAELRREISNFTARSLDYYSVGDITSYQTCRDAANALRRVLGVLEG